MSDKQKNVETNDNPGQQPTQQLDDGGRLELSRHDFSRSRKLQNGYQNRRQADTTSNV